MLNCIYIAYHCFKNFISVVSHTLNSHKVPTELMYRIRISEKYVLHIVKKEQYVLLFVIRTLLIVKDFFTLWISFLPMCMSGGGVGTWGYIIFILFFILFFSDFNFFHYSWFTMFCQFSAVQHHGPVTHIYIHIYIHTHSFSHIILHHALSLILHHAPSQVTIYSSQCCIA